MKPRTDAIAFTVNGRPVSVAAPPIRRLADVLRDDLGLTGTKIGCNAGDCGACTVLLDGAQVCACLVAVGQVRGRGVTTVEGLAANGKLSALQNSFHRHGAAQCGICTPGMLMAASELLSRRPTPTEAEVKDALGGVLCRCTGYLKIVEAVMNTQAPAANGAGAVGARLAKVDGVPKLNGTERFGADVAPADCLWLRVVRSPHASARFTLGDLAGFQRRHPGLVRILTHRDVPNNRFGVYPDIKDQPVLAEGVARYRGDAVLALIGTAEALGAIGDEDVPIAWVETPALADIAAATAPGVAALHADKPDNVLVRGLVRRGDAAAAMERADIVAEGSFETGFVEHAYIEPEAGCARRVGERIEIEVCTQTPVMDRDEVALIMGFERSRVRVIPTACGGGFGGKLDLSVQPLVALGAWLTGRPVACTYTRPESMRATTKRHPSRIHVRVGATRDGKLAAMEFGGDFDTGAYASWGPTVANRVPVHASGPYKVPAVLARTRAIYTNGPPSGAFRGFGVPQAAIAHEAMMDELALRLDLDPLEFRLMNALAVGDETATGQRLTASAGLPACLRGLRPHWRRARTEAEAHNRANGPRRGAGIACMWYGIGNTSMSNPSSMQVGLDAKGRLTLYNGAVDIGQGSNTIMVQICAEALGVPADAFAIVMGDTDRTLDAGKTSASRQTFVSGNAARLAGLDLRRRILRLANAGEGARIVIDGARVRVEDGVTVREVDLSALDKGGGDVLAGTGSFDPPTTTLDGNGQGVPYSTYGFAAQIAEIEIDVALGLVKVLKVTAAHDVGRAINPTQVEGQIHGGIAQGLGFALMEEYVPGRSENLHDYLIPTVGDMPAVEIVLVEDAEPLGPYGAKGVGEPALIATAPAIFGAIHHATGVRIRRAPATPDRIRAALVEAGHG